MIIDISPVLCPETAVWPGDLPLSQNNQCQLANGDSIDLSSLHTTVHIGAHADAPSHYHPEGGSIETVDLSVYWGDCYVVNCKGFKVITSDSCKVIANLNAERVLFRTNTFPDPNHFNQDFAYFNPDAIEFLAHNGVKLIGIDTPSIDPFDSKDLQAHHAIYKYGIKNLEGLILNEVDEGWYELSALPLKLKGFDASPVRAVLKKLDKK